MRSPEGTAHAAFALGSAWLARGRVRTALRWYRESAGLVRQGDTIGFLPWPLAGIAQAAAHAGDKDLAQRALDELEVTPARGTRNFEVALQLTRAWCAAAGGELTRARAQALAAAVLAESLGQDAFAVRALHDVARLGAPVPVAERLRRLADRVDGPFVRDAADHAVALLQRDGEALLAVAERFAAQDALLLAAEAADAAAVAHRERAREASARSAAQRAAAFLEGCEGARPPSLDDEPVVDELTLREREVAVLAAAGLSSRQIADRLVVSIRTVENHLHRTYRKLGISRREDLTRLLTRGSEQVRQWI
jgi:DNA-binding NarL/FixJ family response regulator